MLLFTHVYFSLYLVTLAMTNDYVYYKDVTNIISEVESEVIHKVHEVVSEIVTAFEEITYSERKNESCPDIQLTENYLTVYLKEKLPELSVNCIKRSVTELSRPDYKWTRNACHYKEFEKYFSKLHNVLSNIDENSPLANCKKVLLLKFNKMQENCNVTQLKKSLSAVDASLENVIHSFMEDYMNLTTTESIERQGLNVLFRCGANETTLMNGVVCIMGKTCRTSILDRLMVKRRITTKCEWMNSSVNALKNQLSQVIQTQPQRCLDQVLQNETSTLNLKISENCWLPDYALLNSALQHMQKNCSDDLSNALKYGSTCTEDDKDQILEGIHQKFEEENISLDCTKRIEQEMLRNEKWLRTSCPYKEFMNHGQHFKQTFETYIENNLQERGVSPACKVHFQDYFNQMTQTCDEESFNNTFQEAFEGINKIVEKLIEMESRKDEVDTERSLLNSCNISEYNLVMRSFCIFPSRCRQFIFKKLGTTAYSSGCVNDTAAYPNSLSFTDVFISQPQRCLDKLFSEHSGWKDDGSCWWTEILTMKTVFARIGNNCTQQIETALRNN